MDASGPAESARSASRPGAPVQLRGIAKHYGRHRALDGLDLEIRAGEFITLLGPSGSGKTTTLMLIAGFEQPSAGEIRIGGEAVERLPAYRRNIGMVFQSYALFPHLTVAENVAFALKQRGVGRAERERAVLRMLDLVQLQGFGGRFPQQLSGGQQQRVAIARAIVFQPRVLLMDEPLSALDKQLRENLQLEIKRLHDRLGITFVYVTHDQREALVMSDRVSVMQDGRIEQIAAPQVLYDAPANRFVASFVGEANMLPVERVDPAGNGLLAIRTEAGGIVHACEQAYGPGCLCMVRPEKMRAGPPTAPQPGENAIAATVRDVVFMGEMTRYMLQTEAGTGVVVKQTNRAGTAVLAPGDPASIVWAAEDTRLVS
ncbi:MAG TPA: ABC transporter ATP-binding protein [Acetobacteraceae bacterium]|nr:ABC transporter ATP-binding protein [Acetobacteraceae bacterium]